MVFGFQVVCLLVTLVTVFAYIAHHVYSREHRLLPLFLGVIAVFDFYRIVLMLTGAVGLLGGSVGWIEWIGALGEGIAGMGELIVITLLAGGMLEMIRRGGGIDYLIGALTRKVSGKRTAELSIAALVSMANLCTANNTIAIITTGPIARQIADRFGVDRRKSASLLDSFSCFVQGLIPYGAQLMIAAGLASVSPLEIIGYLYYPMALGICSLLAILLRYPRKYS